MSLKLLKETGGDCPVCPPILPRPINLRVLPYRTLCAYN